MAQEGNSQAFILEGFDLSYQILELLNAWFELFLCGFVTAGPLTGFDVGGEVADRIPQPLCYHRLFSWGEGYWWFVEHGRLLLQNALLGLDPRELCFYRPYRN